MYLDYMTLFVVNVKCELVNNLVVPLIWKATISQDDIRKMIAIGNLSNKRNMAKGVTCWDRVWAAHRVIEAANQAFPEDCLERKKYRAALRREWCVNYDVKETTARGYFNLGNRTGAIWDMIARIYQGQHSVWTLKIPSRSTSSGTSTTFRMMF